jgi:hypothetical protein
MGGKFHLKLNIGTRPIANKYCEGKMKSTLKRELKVRETVKREAIEVSSGFVEHSGAAFLCELVRSVSPMPTFEERSVYARHDPCQHLFFGRERSFWKVAFVSSFMI